MAREPKDPSERKIPKGNMTRMVGKPPKRGNRRPETPEARRERLRRITKNPELESIDD